MSDPTPNLVEALGAHFITWHALPAGPPGEWRCACGQKFGFSDSAIGHQGEMLTSVVADLQAEALRDAADDLEALIDGQHPDALNPDHWLRERAQRLGGTS